jgi:hypothetical protein
MACIISKGRNEVCKESVGGLLGVYFINYTTSSFTTGASGEITAVPSGSILYNYDLKGNSSYTETVNTSRDNGTTFFSQELTLNLKQLTNEMTTQLKLLAYGRPQIIVYTQNGDALLVGQKNGADLTAGTISTGGAMGDLYGYSITFTGMEKLPAAFLTGSTTTSALAGLTQNFTVVNGTNN